MVVGLGGLAVVVGLGGLAVVVGLGGLAVVVGGGRTSFISGLMDFAFSLNSSAPSAEKLFPL